MYSRTRALLLGFLLPGLRTPLHEAKRLSAIHERPGPSAEQVVHLPQVLLIRVQAVVDFQRPQFFLSKALPLLPGLEVRASKKGDDVVCEQVLQRLRILRIAHLLEVLGAHESEQEFQELEPPHPLPSEQAAIWLNSALRGFQQGRNLLLLLLAPDGCASPKVPIGVGALEVLVEDLQLPADV